jgi:UDP-N-acetylmuramoylalanine--D-glutamate ligase
MSAHDFFAHKRVTILGLGLLGRGVGDARFIAGCGASVVVTDTKTEKELSKSVIALSGIETIEFHLGGHRIEDFTECDMVIKGAGVRLNSPEIAAARAAGIPVYMSTALAARFAREAGAIIIGVTGTRGKSTVAHLIHHALVVAKKRAHLGGNVRGMSTLELLPHIARGDFLVLELDSWQLQGFGDLAMSPDVAVFTNLMPDHQNYYASMDDYFADKANIFAFQVPGNTLVCGESIRARIEMAHPPVLPIVPPPVPLMWQMQLIGEHNRENAALAAQALRAIGITEKDIRESLATFAPLAGRLQLVRELRGIKIYNDNNATTPQATIAALEALDQSDSRNIVLIMGGADKGLDVSTLWPAIRTHSKRILFLAGSGTERIRAEVPDAPVYDSVTSAVDAAMSVATPGDIILFSPGFASFGLFKNEYERNDAFVAAVEAL